ncbi:nuclear transport factor 2 family protein [Spirillospora sp. NPDC050679]
MKWRVMDHAGRHELTDLAARLGRRLDEKRFEEVRTVFTEDASISTAGGTDPLIEVDGDTATIAAFVNRPGGRGRLFAERYRLTAAALRGDGGSRRSKACRSGRPPCPR